MFDSKKKWENLEVGMLGQIQNPCLNLGLKSAGSRVFWKKSINGHDEKEPMKIGGTYIRYHI